VLQETAAQLAHQAIRTVVAHTAQQPSCSGRTSPSCRRSNIARRPSTSSGRTIRSRGSRAWTLEGLNALDLALIREQMKDSNPRMRVQAIRASETLYKAAARGLADDYRAMTKDSDPDVVIQALLTANLFKLPGVEALIKETMEANKARGVQEIGQRVLQRIATAAATSAAGFTSEQQEQMKEARRSTRACADLPWRGRTASPSPERRTGR
jgi:hypothetical protein